MPGRTRCASADVLLRFLHQRALRTQAHGDLSVEGETALIDESVIRIGGRRAQNSSDAGRGGPEADPLPRAYRLNRRRARSHRECRPCGLRRGDFRSGELIDLPAFGAAHREFSGAMSRCETPRRRVLTGMRPPLTLIYMIHAASLDTARSQNRTQLIGIALVFVFGVATVWIGRSTWYDELVSSLGISSLLVFRLCDICSLLLLILLLELAMRKVLKESLRSDVSAVVFGFCLCIWCVGFLNLFRSLSGLPFG